MSAEPLSVHVAYQGEPGAYSEEAVLHHFGDVERKGFSTFDAVFAAVLSGDAQCAVVPVRNSNTGSIQPVTALIEASDVVVEEDFERPIVHALLGTSSAQLRDIVVAVSHPEALRQCADQLRNLGIQPEVAQDTAGAARMVAYAARPERAAIASARAGELYGLTALIPNVGPADNRTQFAVIKRRAG